METKFIQIMGDGGYLYALDSAGVVWAWNGSAWVVHSQRPVSNG